MTAPEIRWPTPADNVFDYPPPIWRWFGAAPRAGRFPAAELGVRTGRAGTPASRSVLELQLKFVDGRVADARFRAYGCPASIAVGAWIADWSLGRDAAALAQLRAADLRQALEIADEKAHCALMGEDALQALLKSMSEEVR
jgi:NifU-like protein involved in Fe-S cluster formation